MKIICTKEEYTRMVAQCARNNTNLAIRNEPPQCEACVLFDMCRTADWQSDRIGVDYATGDGHLFLCDITEIRE
ncbi:MAG: hypothetical protein HFE75_08775 [Firmicutes bacterium]|jgi:hypothetical protein|nr:hypothetical protein [Bacillota bacterium]